MDVLTIGDALVAFTPSTTGPLRFASNFERTVGGAELNVAIGCSRLGLKTGWISRLGDDEFGKHVFNFVRGEGVDVSEVKLVKGYQTSIYFKEMINSSKINSYYYRNNSPTRTLTSESLNEEYIRETKILHITGVFPAVDPANGEVIMQLLKVAKAHNISISMDPNIRLKLWDEETAKHTLLSYMPYVDILLLGIEEAEILFGTSDSSEVFQLAGSYGVQDIVLKQGAKGAIGQRNGEVSASPAIKDVHVVDEIGAGDGFASGYLYSRIHDYPLEKSLKIANAVAAHVISVNGDNEGLPYKEEVEVMLGDKVSISR
ncbi:sugar kinase [Lysinibacillus sphaericus]